MSTDDDDDDDDGSGDGMIGRMNTPVIVVWFKVTAIPNTFEISNLSSLILLWGSR
jgi:hypothetical protein